MKKLRPWQVGTLIDSALSYVSTGPKNLYSKKSVFLKYSLGSSEPKL